MKYKIIIPIFLCAALIACGNPTSDSNEPVNSSLVQSTTDMPETEPYSKTTSAIEETSTSITQDSYGIMLYDENEVKITYKSIGVASDYVALNVEIENYSEYDLIIQTRDFSVNDYMTRAAFSPEVLSGKKINAKIRIFEDEFQNNGMSMYDLRHIEFRFAFCTTGFEDAFEDSDIVTLDFTPNQ